MGMGLKLFGLMTLLYNNIHKEGYKMKKNINTLSNLSVVSNITVEPYFSKNLKSLFSSNYDIQFHCIAYENYINTIETIKESNVILIWINVDVLIPNLCMQSISHSFDESETVGMISRLFREMVDNIKKVSNAKIVIMTQDCNSFDSVYKGNVISKFDIFRKINNKIINDFSSNHIIVDINKIISMVGTNNTYDVINKYRWNAIYSPILIKEIAIELHKQFLIFRGITKKCLVLDCDNVLWGGILSEDGDEGIILSNSGPGQYYQDFQRFVLGLYHHGVIIAISSKNDKVDVMDVFRKHSGMVLREEHISCFKINWRNKAENILEISNFLNIGLDSIVFVDDSSFEIGLVNSTLPEITTILFENSEIDYSKFNCFNLNDSIEQNTIKIRTNTYQTNEKRLQLQKNSINYNEYLKSLNTTTTISLANKWDLNRIYELSLRTNQCTSGIRYSLEKIIALHESKICDMYSVFVEDRFGALGLVGAIIVEKNELSLFSLSCRALGRGIEDSMIDFIINNCYIEKIKFVDTNRNKNKLIKEKLFSRLCP